MSLKEATTCPQGFVLGCSIIIPPAFSAVLTFYSTLSVVNPISIPKGLLVKLLSILWKIFVNTLCDAKL
jgi:hypothetical protein